MENSENDIMDEIPESPAGLEENSPGELEMEPPKEDIDAEGDKKVIDELLKRNRRKIIVIGGVILGTVLILVAMFSTTEVHKKPYYETTCTSVTVKYAPYDESIGTSTKTFGLEEYVSKAVAEYTKNLISPPSGIFQVYYALAIALRTEIIANNCTITYRDKDFNVTLPTDSVFTSAMTAATGVVIGSQEKKLTNAKVSDFCWKTKNENNYMLYQTNNMIIPINFANDYLASDIYTDCPCNQPDESLDKCWVKWEVEEEDEEGNTTTYTESEWLHYDEETGFSMYGAFYLMMQHGFGYDQLLKYFFGDDIMYMTVDKSLSKEETPSNNASTNCSEFSLTNTTLSKEELVAKVEAYKYSSDKAEKVSAWETFVKNAGHIYDMAVSNNINPEMIFVRGILEGFSPGASKHNYFGITCYNGQPEKCTVYQTFDDGIMGFINLLKKYDSFASFAGRYAYLGDHWYNPGNSGDGGCYYAKYIYPNGLDSYVQDACSDARKNHCAARGDKSQCLPTRDEDKKAYNLYQGKNMTNLRFKMFGIEENDCTNNTLNYGNCQIFAQGDPRWGSETLGFGPSTIHGAGCALTSVAIAMTCTGQTDDDFTPLVLNEALKNNKGFDGDLIYWGNNALTQFVPTFKIGAIYTMNKNDSIQSKMDVLKNGLKENRIGIIHVKNSEHPAGHFIVLQSINESNNTITALDPAGGKIATYSIGDIDGFKYYTY